MNRRTKIALIAIVFIPLLVSNALAGESIVGQQAPKISVSRWLTPNPPTATSLEGRVHVIEFWTTWCPHCVRIIPTINQLADKYADKEVLFIALSEYKTPIEVKNMILAAEIITDIESRINKKLRKQTICVKLTTPLRLRFIIG